MSFVVSFVNIQPSSINTLTEMYSQLLYVFVQRIQLYILFDAVMLHKVLFKNAFDIEDVYLVVLERAHFSSNFSFIELQNF